VKRLAALITAVFIISMAVYAQADSSADLYNLKNFKYAGAISAQQDSSGLHKISYHKKHGHKNGEKSKQRISLVAEPPVTEKIDTAAVHTVKTMIPEYSYIFNPESTGTIYKDKINLTILKSRK
jgi:hypothetical protein